MVDYYKPPLGVMPKWLWIEQRVNELRRAINDRLSADMPIPTEWVQEYNDLVAPPYVGSAKEVTHD